MSTRLFAPSGTPVQAKGGDISSPSQVYFLGMAPPSEKASNSSLSVMGFSSACERKQMTSIPAINTVVSQNGRFRCAFRKMAPVIFHGLRG